MTEYLHTGTQKELLAWESTLKETGCSPVAVPDSDFIGQTCSHDPYVQVTLANGVVALLSESGGHTTIYWIEPAVVEGIKLDPGLLLYVEVQGASGDLSGDEATSLATSLVKGDG